MNRNAMGLAAAAAVLSMLAAGVAPTASAAPKDGGVKCAGINSCKGTAECKTASNECKGHNSCKGHGWVSKPTAESCTAAGGTVI